MAVVFSRELQAAVGAGKVSSRPTAGKLARAFDHYLCTFEANAIDLVLTYLRARRKSNLQVIAHEVLNNYHFSRSFIRRKSGVILPSLAERIRCVFELHVMQITFGDGKDGY